MNSADYRESLKHSYFGQSMQPKQEVIIEEETKEDRVLEIVKQYTVSDTLLLRARRPTVSKSDRTGTLNYSGRVKQSSKKNC